MNFCNIVCQPDIYPKNYWKKCQLQFGNCNRLKRKGKCYMKWNNILTGACKNSVPSWHRNRAVNQYCKTTCPGCSKKLLEFIFN